MDRFILETQLREYAGGGLYPMHMPGHKRRLAPGQEVPCGWDMTEVPGVDDLHEAEGILAEAMDRTAALHGAERTWYLVNGSTCGLLSGIRALAPADAEILVARNCHKAVYHAIELGNLCAHWLTPPVVEDFGVYGSVSPAEVARSLEAYPNVRCVVLTSPTYEGVISDIGAIAEVCHRAGVPLLVDEAHGAHLGLAEGWPRSAVQLGADLVVESAHKTLPSLTQTALLHLGRNSLADPEEVERQLDVFETSSPSYLLMASLDGCTGLLREDGDRLFADWKQQLAEFDAGIAGLKHLKVLGHGRDRAAVHREIFALDPGKLPICTAGTEFSGRELMDALRTEFGFELEMACGDLALAMTTMCDDAAAVERFAQALVQLDRRCRMAHSTPAIALPAPGETVCTIARGLRQPAEDVPLPEAEGKVCGEYVWAYPPGVPLIAPGERVTAEFLAAVHTLGGLGTALHHSHCKKEGNLRVFA